MKIKNSIDLNISSKNSFSEDVLAQNNYGLDGSGLWLEDAIPFNAALIKAEPKIMVIVENLFPAIFKFIKQDGRIKKLNTANGSARLKYTCKAVLFNLYLASLVGSPIRYARDTKRYTRARRYGQLFFKYHRLIPVIAAFEHLGLIHHRPGRYDRSKTLGRQARMWASERLIAMFNKATQGYPCQVFSEGPEEPVILKDSKKMVVDYIDTQETNAFRSNLASYNDFIAKNKITVASNGDREISLYNLKYKLLFGVLKGDATLNNITNTGLTNSNVGNKDSYGNNRVYTCRVIKNNSNNNIVGNGSNSVSITHNNFILPIDEYIDGSTRVYVCGDKLSSASRVRDPYAFRLGNKIRIDDFKLPYFSMNKEYVPKHIKEFYDTVNFNMLKLKLGNNFQLTTEKAPLNKFNIGHLNFVINSKKLYRIFNNNSFDQGGRFYGAFYQTMPKDLRKDVLINGEPTVELDYAAHHVRIPYHLEGVDYREDPYLAFTDDPKERSLFKKLLLIAINAKTEREFVIGFRNAFKATAKQENLSLTSASILTLLQRAKTTHNQIAGYVNSGAGCRLQNLDSQITEAILMRMTEMGIPCLPVHDSYIVPRQHEDRLRDVMVGEYRAVLGFEPVIK